MLITMAEACVPESKPDKSYIKPPETEMETENDKILQLPCFDGYRFTSFLGQGSLGRVYLAEPYDPDLQKIAVKIIPRVLTNGMNVKIEDIFREVQIMRSLNHPNVIGTTDMTYCNGDYFMFQMRFCVNGDLIDLLSNRDLSRPEFEKYTAQLACAVKYLHTNRIYHGDIKLENLLIDEGYNLVLTDFGQSFKLPRSSDVPPAIKGTPPYVAPEVYNGGPINAFKLDAYAMGIAIWSLYVGQDVYAQKSRKDFIPALNRVDGGRFGNNIRVFLTALLQEQPSARWNVNVLVQYLKTLPCMLFVIKFVEGYHTRTG